MSEHAENEHRDYPEGVYFIDTKKEGEVVGKIACYRPGLKLIDFYRTSPVLAKDEPPRLPSEP